MKRSEVRTLSGAVRTYAKGEVRTFVLTVLSAEAHPRQHTWGQDFRPDRFVYGMSRDWRREETPDSTMEGNSRQHNGRKLPTARSERKTPGATSFLDNSSRKLYITSVHLTT